jgi:hypothetical protein
VVLGALLSSNRGHSDRLSPSLLRPNPDPPRRPG